MRVVGIFLLVLALVVGLIFGVAAFRGYTAPFFGRMDAEVQIESAESRIANYNRFFDQCAAVQGYEHQIEVLQEQLDETPADDRDEINRLRQSIAGLRGQRARAIAEYNADASKSYTAARFHASNLPYRLSVEGETRCDA